MSLRFQRKPCSVDNVVNGFGDLEGNKNMTVNIGKELAALQRLTIKELKARYAEVFGEATNAANRAWLVKRISWRLQALAEGDLSERAAPSRRACRTRQRRGHPPFAAEGEGGAGSRDAA